MSQPSPCMDPEFGPSVLMVLLRRLREGNNPKSTDVVQVRYGRDATRESRRLSFPRGPIRALQAWRQPRHLWPLRAARGEGGDDTPARELSESEGLHEACTRDAATCQPPRRRSRVAMPMMSIRRRGRTRAGGRSAHSLGLTSHPR